MLLPENYYDVYETARRYDEGGDLYHAVKLYKKVIRLQPDFPEPYLALGRIYRQRKEWKPAFHYWKIAISLNADDREAWWQLGLAAVALKRMRVAQTVWNKFGYGEMDVSRPLGLRIANQKDYEIIWMQPLDAGRCRILSIPMPGSGLRYRQTMLYNRRGLHGSNVVNARRVPIYEAVDSLKNSPYDTYSCLLHTGNKKKIKQLETLAFEAGLGFEVWSNASRTMSIEHKNAFPEYYNDIIPHAESASTVVALAAIHPAEVERVLNDWQIISLGQFSDLRKY
ncbi:MAG: tetratricopeptide repeat protein [Bacteroidota bacterium]